MESWSKKDHKDQEKKEKKKETKRESVCSACQKSFPQDINLSFQSARKKAEKELKAHQKTCSLMSDPEKVKKVLQEKWRAESKISHIYNAYSCRKCWGKIYWDKNIPEAVKAKLHAIADLIYHEKHECSTELAKPKIAIYFSPNEGGNEHAPLSYAEKIDESKLMLEKIYEMELSQKQVSRNSIVPWIIGGSLLFTGGFLLFLIYYNQRKNLIRGRKDN